MKGKLIIIEAGDGCGKATQANALYERLLQEQKNVRKVEFPDYDSPSSSLVKMYLSGAFGAKAEDVNAYAASSFYAVDRYASYKSKWESFYRSGGIVIADRYTASNMVHQAVKIESPKEKDAYFKWLWDLEFVKLSLPVPDVVIFLEVPPAFSFEMIAGRKAKLKKDIHENDEAYLTHCYQAYCDLAKRYGWHVVSCVENNQMKPIELIHQEIYKIVQNIL